MDDPVLIERARCAAWAKLYWDGDLSDEYEMYVGIRDGLPPPMHLQQPDDVDADSSA